MKPTHSLSLAALLATTSLPYTATSQIFGVEHIDQGLVNLDRSRIFWFPNSYDPSHPKRLTFQGVANPNSSGTQTWPLNWGFSWVDSLGDIWDVRMPPVIPRFDDIQTWIFSGEYVISFCPERVGITFWTEHPLGYYVEGDFTHECLIPEPEYWGAVTVLGLLGFGLWRRRVRTERV